MWVKLGEGLVACLKIWIVTLQATGAAGFKHLGDGITVRIFKDHSASVRRIRAKIKSGISVRRPLQEFR